MINLIEKTGKDKLLHFIVGAFVGIAGAILIIWILNNNPTWASDFWIIPKFQIVLGAAFFGAVIGLVKEFVWDSENGISHSAWAKRHGVIPGTFDLRDAVWTIFGSVVGGIVIWLMALMFHLGDTTPPPSQKEILIDTKIKLEHIHDNDPASFDNESKDLKARADSLAKILYEKTKE